MFRGSHPHPVVFCKKGVLENFAKFIGIHLCWNLFLIKLKANLLMKVFNNQGSTIRDNSFSTYAMRDPIMSSCIRDHHQLLLLILSEIDRIKQLLFPLKSSENLWFSDDFRGNTTLQTHHVYSTLKRRGNDRSTSFQRGIHVACL